MWKSVFRIWMDLTRIQPPREKNRIRPSRKTGYRTSLKENIRSGSGGKHLIRIRPSKNKIESVSCLILTYTIKLTFSFFDIKFNIFFCRRICIKYLFFLYTCRRPWHYCQNWVGSGSDFQNLVGSGSGLNMKDPFNDNFSCSIYWH